MLNQRQRPILLAVAALVIIWALLSDEQAQFIDLGPDYYASRAR